MRRLTVVSALVAGAALAAGPAAAQTSHDMGAGATADIGEEFVTYSPSGVDVVTGDTVRWTNDSVRPHTATADDGSFDSGRMVSGDTFTRHTTAEGVIAFHCELHATMRGEVRVHDVLLRAPAGGAAPGKPFPLDGRTALAEGTPVSIEADSGAGFAAVASTTVGADGTFAASVTPSETATYRAVVGGRTSPPIAVPVLDRHVAATAHRRGRRLVVDVRVTPASPGGTLVLQAYLERRFGWWPLRRARLDRRSRARLVVPLAHRPRVRVLLTLPDGATTLASSGPIG